MPDSCNLWQANAARLKAYRGSVVLFPRRSSKPKQGDASKEELSSVTQHTGRLLPVKQDKHTVEKATLTDELKVMPLCCLDPGLPLLMSGTGLCVSVEYNAMPNSTASMGLH